MQTTAALVPIFIAISRYSTLQLIFPTRYYRRFILPLLALVATAIPFVSCSSGGEANPTPETGSIQGVVGPPGAATLTTATNNKGQVFTAVPDANTGVYTVSSVPTGLYTVRFTPTPGFAALSSANPLVMPNQTVQADTSFMSITTSAALTGSVFWQHDGKTGGAQ